MKTGRSSTARAARPPIRLRRVLPLLLLAAVGAACEGEGTGPVGSGEIRIAHVAAGAPDQAVEVDGEVLAGSLAIGESARTTVEEGQHTVDVAGEQRLQKVVEVESGMVHGLLVADPAAPFLFSVALPATTTRRAALRLVNTTFVSTLTMTLSGNGAEASADVRPMGTGSIEVDPGEYRVTVRTRVMTEDEAVDLGTLQVPEGAGFVVVYHPGSDIGEVEALYF